MIGGDGHLLAGFVIAGGGLGDRRCLHRADLAPSFVAASLRDRGLDPQQFLFDRLCLRERRRQGRQHAVRLGGAARGEPGARGAQQELGAVAAGGLCGEFLVNAGGACIIATGAQLLRAIHAHAWRAAHVAARWTTREQQRRRDHGHEAERSDQSFLERHASNSLCGLPRVDTRRRSIVAVNSGRLAVISTPIGNLGDLSPRARDELAGAELVAAEDTRRTGQLLTTLGLTRPLVSLHEHNETERIDELLQRLRGGARIALVSDAGTPLLSDPGFELVRRVAEEGVSIVAVPGPSAITAALSIAGLPTERFSFEGFLPARLAERRTRLAELAAEPRTLVFFEAPHRIAESLDDMCASFGGERRAAVARELTKVFETVYRGTLSSLVAQSRSDANFTRGEITVVIEGAARTRADPRGEQLDA